MKRRAFLSFVGAAAVAPALPSLGTAKAAASVATGYNRYMYGLGVFHARNCTSLSVADLMAKLKLNAVQADAMMSEMTVKGVLSPVTGAVRATAGQNLPRKPYIRKAMRQLHEAIETQTSAPEIRDQTDHSDTPAPKSRVCTNSVHPAKR